MAVFVFIRISPWLATKDLTVVKVKCVGVRRDGTPCRETLGVYDRSRGLWISDFRKRVDIFPGIPWLHECEGCGRQYSQRELAVLIAHTAPMVLASQPTVPAFVLARATVPAPVTA